MSTNHPITNKEASPVILIGRGGSGTRLLSQLAMSSGVFLGNVLNKSDDSIEWVQLVYRLVLLVGGQTQLPSGSQFRHTIQQWAGEILKRRNYDRNEIWGWKLPETMVLLPLFLDAFPLAKVVHFIRHPVSLCLRRSHMTSRLGNPIGNIVLPAAYKYAGRNLSAIDSDKSYLHNAYSWNYQVRRVMQYGRNTLNSKQYLEMKYEDVCSDETNALTELHEFIGIDGSVESTSLLINEQRLNQNNHSDSRAQEVWDICGETAANLGYAFDPQSSNKQK